MLNRFRTKYSSGIVLKVLASILVTELIIMLIFNWLSLEKWMSPFMLGLLDAILLTAVMSLVMVYWVVEPVRIVEEQKRDSEVRAVMETLHDVAYHKDLAEDALKQSEERSRMLFQRSPVGILRYDRNLYVTECNDRFVEILQSSREKLLGLDMKTLKDQSVLPAISEAIEGKEGDYEGFYRATTSSTAIWISMRTVPILDGEGKIIGGAGIVEDITERKQAEDLLRQSEEKYRNLVERSHDGIIIVQDGIIKFTNARMAELDGSSVDQLVGTSFTDHVHPSELSRLVDIYRRRMAGEMLPSTYETILLRKDGSFAPAELNAGIITYGEKPADMVIIRDITERKKAEEELIKSEVSYKELTVILGESLGEVKKREQTLLKGRDAFLNMLEDVSESYKELVLAYDTTIEGWSNALDYRDKETEGHSQRVTEITLQIARATGTGEEELAHLRRGALLHDIGKMGIPDNILLKPGKLTDEEWVVMKRHPEIAYELLSPIVFLRPALDIPHCHHEKWDGTGYPRGLRGEQIPLAARIFALVDVWDALRSDRPYRPAWPEERVFEHIRMSAGSHFDPEVVELFLKVLGKSE